MVCRHHQYEVIPHIRIVGPLSLLVLARRKIDGFDWLAESFLSHRPRGLRAVTRLLNAMLGGNTLLAGICFQDGCQEEQAGYRLVICDQQQCTNDFLIITPGGKADLPQLEVQM